MTDLRKAAEGAREALRSVPAGLTASYEEKDAEWRGHDRAGDKANKIVREVRDKCAAAHAALDAALSAPAPAPGEAEGLCDELEGLLAKATKGPWKQHLVDDTTIMAGDFEIGSTWPEGGADADLDFNSPTELHEANAALIVAAVNALPELIATIRRLTAEKAKAEGELAWTGEVHPATNAEGGGAVVHVTWDQWNGLRMLAGLSAQKATGYRVFSVAKSSLDQWKRDQAARVEAAEQRAEAAERERDEARDVADNALENLDGEVRKLASERTRADALAQECEKLRITLRKLQTAAAIGLESIPEDQHERPVAQAFIAVHRTVCEALSLPPGPDEAASAARGER